MDHVAHAACSSCVPVIGGDANRADCGLLIRPSFSREHAFILHRYILARVSFYVPNKFRIITIYVTEQDNYLQHVTIQHALCQPTRLVQLFLFVESGFRLAGHIRYILDEEITFLLSIVCE